MRCEQDGAVARLTLARPERLNALSIALTSDLIAALVRLEEDERVRSVVLTGEGRGFCSGADLADAAERVSGGGAAERLAYMRTHERLVTAMRESRLPIVAALSGPVYGAGWSVALACDLIVASADARFCQVFVKRGLVPDLGSAWLLPRAVGALRARELMLLGEEITAEEAFSLGLVNRLLETPQQALEVAGELASRLSDAPVATMAMAKSLMNGSEHGPLSDSIRAEQLMQAIALGTEESLTALRAFLDRRRS